MPLLLGKGWIRSGFTEHVGRRPAISSLVWLCSSRLHSGRTSATPLSRCQSLLNQVLRNLGNFVRQHSDSAAETWYGHRPLIIPQLELASALLISHCHSLPNSGTIDCPFSSFISDQDWSTEKTFVCRRAVSIKTPCLKKQSRNYTAPLYVKQMRQWHTSVWWPPNTLLIIIQSLY